MSPENFVYWLVGFSELHGGCPNEQQWESIKDHLQLVMNKETPVRDVEVESPLKWTLTNPSNIRIDC